MIAAIENGILARLRGAADADALGYRWRLLETYPADWDAYFKSKTQLDAPAAWATFGGFERFERSNEGPIGHALVGVVVAASNLRNETATRHGVVLPDGKRAEPGSYQLMLDAIALLDGVDLGLDMSPLQVATAQFVSPANVALLRQSSLIAIAFRTNFTIEARQLEGGGLADFSMFHANWDLPPAGDVDADPAAPGVQLPADATADATDHLEVHR